MKKFISIKDATDGEIEDGEVIQISNTLYTVILKPR